MIDSLRNLFRWLGGCLRVENLMSDKKWYDCGESFPTDLKRLRELANEVTSMQKGLAQAQRNLRRESGGMELVTDVVIPRSGVFTCKLPLELDGDGNLAGRFESVAIYVDGVGEMTAAQMNEETGKTASPLEKAGAASQKALLDKITTALALRIKKINEGMESA